MDDTTSAPTRGRPLLLALILLLLTPLIIAAVWLMAGWSRSPVPGNERAAIATLRLLVVNEELFQARTVVDLDRDERGEYGWLGELTGVVPPRGAEAALAAELRRAPLLPAEFGASRDAGGVAQRQGYCFLVYLPQAGGAWLAEPRAAGSTSPDDADVQERRWLCYAWPVDAASGRRCFVAGAEGPILDCAEATSPYQGPAAPPPASAALAGDGRLAIGGPGGDGHTWRPVD